MDTSVDVAALVEAHHATLWRYLRFLGCDRATADDLTQETFLAVMQKPFAWRGRREASAYLRQAARNLFLMQARRSKLIRNVEDLDRADAAWDRGHGDDTQDRQRALNDCLQAVQGKAREVLDLQYRDRRSGDEIARLLKLSAENVRVMTHRTKQALKKCIESKLEGSA
jgi:RNA polymerase sigma-70 factor, ECF subfamily